jgi:hypothetical protein
MIEYRTITSLETKLRQLKFTKDLKKDYYRHYPDIKTYREICELISRIKYLEFKLKN